jgi:hypothetical protein
MIRIGALFCSFALASPALASEEGPVWFWFAECGGPTMRLEVQLDQKVIYTSSFPLCRAERSSTYSDGQKSKLQFSFTPGRPIVWTGYRDEDDTTGPGQALEGDIWLAGADPDDMMLGVGFIAEDTIYMNTIHIAYPDKPSQTEIASGLTVLTTPIMRPNPPNKTLERTRE